MVCRRFEFEHFGSICHVWFDLTRLAICASFDSYRFAPAIHRESICVWSDLLQSQSGLICPKEMTICASIHFDYEWFFLPASFHLVEDDKMVRFRPCCSPCAPDADTACTAARIAL